MRKMIAMLLTISMIIILLAGCGGNEAAVSSAAPAESVTEEASVPVEESVIAEAPSVHEDGGPMDSVELAKWVWEKADIASESHYAEDYDISMTIEIDVAGEYSYTQSSIRSKEITSDNGAIIYTKTTSNGETSEVWYGDGAYYQSSSLGNFKIPMTFEEYEAQEDSDATENPMANIEPDQFGKLFATRISNGYGVNFSQPTLDTWMAFADMFTSEDQESYTCETFDLEGYMQCDEAGNVTQVKMDMTVTLNIMGVPMTMVITANQLTMGYDENVTIEIPAEDESFIELPDLTIPTALLSSQLVTSAMPSLQYQSIWQLEIEDEIYYDVITQTDNISYATTEAGLSARWNTESTINGEPDYWSKETYDNGRGTFADSYGEDTFTYTNDEYFADVIDYIFLYSNSFGSGSEFETFDENGLAVLTYDLQPSYAEEAVADYLELCGVEFYMSESTIIDSYGNYTYWFDNSGLLRSQLMTLVVQVEYEGMPTTLTMKIAGDVLATGSDVIIE